MSTQWVPKGYVDPDSHADETLTPKALPLEWGGTGLSAANLAALKTYLGITSTGVGGEILPLRRLQVVEPTSLPGFDRFGLPAPTITSPGGATSLITVATGVWLRMIDDSSIPSPAELSISHAVQRRWNPDITFVIKPQVAVTGTVGRLWVGLSNDLNLSALDDLSTIAGGGGSGIGRVAAFRFHGSLDAGAGTFKCFTADNTNQQQVQGTVGFTNDGFNAVRIRHTGGGTWEFSVYNTATDAWVVEASITATIGASDIMYPYISLERTAAIAGNRNLEVKMIDIRMS